MKKRLAQLIHQPKVLLPAAAVAAAILGLAAAHFVGRPPAVNLGPNVATSTAIVNENGSIGLSFPKSGRLGSLDTKLGQRVKAGQVLASLEANDARGAVKQAKGALELARAQYASLDVQYTNAKHQQDVLVTNAYRTLLSSGLTAVAVNKDPNNPYAVDVASSQTPIISDTYTCDKEGEYDVKPYPAGSLSGYSFELDGLEQTYGTVITTASPQPLGQCGLFIQFPTGYSAGNVNWIISIPNQRATNYVTNKNAYDLAVATRDQVLKQYEANLGQNGSSAANIAQAAVDSAEGVYEAALGAYQNNLIVAPTAGVITFIDPHLQVGQAVIANKAVITISQN